LRIARDILTAEAAEGHAERGNMECAD
jgi:hypothetical protein